MIVVPEDEQPSKKSLEASFERVKVQHEDDPPPIYSAPVLQTATASTTPLARYVPDVKPSNFTYVSRANGGVKGTWLVDSTLVIPPALLPPLLDGETEDTRKNLMLESRNGSVDADIYLLPLKTEPSAIVKQRQRTVILGKSLNGNVITKFHDLLSHPDETRLPLHITCNSSNGNVHVYIPRSFEGLVNVRTRNGNPKFSEAVRQLIVPISDIGGLHRSFLGHFDPSRWDGDSEWLGDELHAESWNGSVRISFEDEAESTFSMKNGKSGGFFGKLFNF